MEDPEPTDEQEEAPRKQADPESSPKAAAVPASSVGVSPLAAALNATITFSKPSAAAAMTSNNDAPTSSSAAAAASINAKTKEEPPEDLYPSFGRSARGGGPHSFNKFGNSSGGVGGISSANDPPKQNLLDALKNINPDPPSGGGGPSALGTHLLRNNRSSSLLNVSEHSDDAVTEVMGGNQTANRVKFYDQTFANEHSPYSQQQQPPQQQPPKTWSDLRISSSSNPSLVLDTPRYAATAAKSYYGNSNDNNISKASTHNQSFLDRKLHQFNYLKKNSALLAIMAGCVFVVLFGGDHLRGSIQTKRKLPERRLNHGVEDFNMSSPTRGIMDDSSNVSPFIPGGPMQLNVDVDGGVLPEYFSKMMGGGSQQQQQQAELDAELDMAIQHLGNEAIGQDQPEEEALANQQMQMFKEAREQLKAEAEAAAEAQALRQQQKMQATALVIAQQSDLAAAAEASNVAAAQQEQQAAQADAEQQQPVETPSDPVIEAALQRAAAESQEMKEAKEAWLMMEAARLRASAESQEMEAARQPASEGDPSDPVIDAAGNNFGLDENVDDNGVIYPWAKSNLAPLIKSPDREREQVVFWHIPKSGGTTIKQLFKCLRQPGFIVNRMQMLQRMLPTKQYKVLITSGPSHLIRELLNEEHPGRVLSMFRHPVDRLISQFYYLQVATWERGYNPLWKDMSLLDWAASNENGDNNHYVKRLAGKTFHHTATEMDLERAKHTIAQYFVVGLTNQMEESARRFNVVLGVDVVIVEQNAWCMRSHVISGSARVRNSNEHPKVEINDPAYQLLAEKNSLDIQLYEYLEELFEQQKDLIDSYPR